MSFKDFKVVEAIGKGSFASVYKVVRKSDNKVYALKRVKIKYEVLLIRSFRSEDTYCNRK